jgi:hypothetical protein
MRIEQQHTRVGRPSPRVHEVERRQLWEPAGAQAQVVQGREVAGAEPS